MNVIRKTWKKATYFEGNFELRDKDKNWASPIEFPTVFVAYGAAIKSGNWQLCTCINTPKYVIEHYFDGNDNPKDFWNAVFQLEHVTWNDVLLRPDLIKKYIASANQELSKLKRL